MHGEALKISQDQYIWLVWLWWYTGELIRPEGSIEHLSCCFSCLLSLDNYSVNDCVLKEIVLGCILNPACAALCTWESLQTLRQFLISSVWRACPCYAALFECVIIIFVRAAYSFLDQFPQSVFFTALVANPCGAIFIAADGLGSSLLLFLCRLFFPSPLPCRGYNELQCHQMVSLPTYCRFCSETNC